MKAAAHGLLMLARWAIRTARRLDPTIIQTQPDPIDDIRNIIRRQQDRR